MDIFHQSFLSYDYGFFDNFVFSLKELKSLMATAGGMWALLTSCYIGHFEQFITQLFPNLEYVLL